MWGQFERVLIALDRAEVEYLIVGGVAVVLHGHLRTTTDLDLVVRLEPQNARRAIEALSSIGLLPRVPVDPAEFADSSVRERWATEKNMLVFTMWDPSDAVFKVDLFVREPFDFEAAYARRVRVDLRGVSASVVSLADLLALKREAGRHQDLADVEVLETLEATDDV